MGNQINFWDSEEWRKLKNACILRTDKLLSRVEYLKEVGYQNFSDKKYEEYKKNYEIKNKGE